MAAAAAAAVDDTPVAQPATNTAGNVYDFDESDTDETEDEGSHASAPSTRRQKRAKPDGRHKTTFKPGVRTRKRKPESALGRLMARADKQATRRHPKQNDAQSTVKALEQEQWAQAHAWMSEKFCERVDQLEQDRKTPDGKKGRRHRVPRLSPGSKELADRHGYDRSQIYKDLLAECQQRFKDVNWSTAEEPDGALKSCPARMLQLRNLEKHIKDKQRGPGVQPRQRGQAPRHPRTLGPAVESTIAMNQYYGKTGGAGKSDAKAMFEEAIKDSPWSEMFDTASKFETAYRTWLTTQGGALSRAAVTADSETDVTRMVWMRYSILILWQMGIFRELIRLGFMTPHIELLPPGSAGCEERWAEYGLNYTQGTWVPEKMDYVKFGDERDVTLSYNPRKGGRNLQVFARTVAGLPLQRLQASLKSLTKVTQFGSLTASGWTLAAAYIFASQSQRSPGEFVPVCQLCAAVDGAVCPGELCECTWYAPDQTPIARCDLRRMAFGLAVKLVPDVWRCLNGRHVTGETDEGKISGVIVGSDASTGQWEVEWDDGSYSDHDWETLVPLLDEGDHYIGDDPDAENAALELGAAIARAIKPDWVWDLPTADVHMDGRDKLFHAKVGYNGSGGRTTELWQRCKDAVWNEIHDDLSVLNASVGISDGATGLLDAKNNINDLLNGVDGIPTSPNASAVAQPSDDSSLHGAASEKEDAEIAKILMERRTGCVADGVAADPNAKLTMCDFARVMRAGHRVLGNRDANRKALENTGFVPASIAATLSADKTVDDLDGDKEVQLTTALHNTHCKSLLAAM